MYWSSENPNIHEEKAVNLPGPSLVWCVSCSGIVGPYFFEGIVTGATYLNKLEVSIFPTTHHLDGDEEIYYQQDGALPHYHRDVHCAQ